MLTEVIFDAFMMMGMTIYGPKEAWVCFPCTKYPIYLLFPVQAATRPDFIQYELPSHLKQLSKFMENRKWGAGDYVTGVDFDLHEYLDIVEIFEPGTLANYPSLDAFHTRFRELPRIKEYVNSDRWMAK